VCLEKEMDVSEQHKLPEKLSGVIEIALNDLAQVETDPDYKVDMWDWHVSRRHDDRCHVCLAGGVLAKTFRYPPTKTVTPYWILDTHDRVRLVALDELRQGNLAVALQLLYGMGGAEKLLEEHDLPRAIDIRPYSLEPAAFKARLAELVSLLKEKGL